MAVVLVAVGLTACFDSKDVTKFSIGLNDQTGAAVLTLTPDYSKRTFAVDYKKNYVDSKQKSAASTGQMGGEYFDRFETMSKVVKNYKNSAATAEKLSADVTKPMLKAVVEGTDKNTSIMEVSTMDTSKDVQDMKSFYEDIVKLLTESTPV